MQKQEGETRWKRTGRWSIRPWQAPKDQVNKTWSGNGLPYIAYLELLDICTTKCEYEAHIDEETGSREEA